MFKKATCCKRCRQQIGTDFFDCIQCEGGIAGDINLPQEIEMPDLNEELLDRIVVEKTEKFGTIIKYPCKYCGEDNFLNVAERTTILFSLYLSLFYQS